MKKTRLSDIFNADSIRNKKRILDRFEINKKEKRLFLDAIEEVENNKGGSGDKVVLEEKDCNFYDYDGTLLYSYTKEEALALTELPPLPIQPGLICQEWNWDLEDIIDNDGVCDAGAIYTTDNGETRLYIKIDSDTKNIILTLGSKTPDVIIDWGDRVIESFVDNAQNVVTRKNHNYNNIGYYCIKINVINKDGVLKLGNDTTIYNNGIFASDKTENGALYQRILIKAFIGNNVTIGLGCFRDAVNLEKVTLSNTCNINGDYCFMNCCKINHVNLPKDVSIGSSFFLDAYLLKTISFPAKIRTYESLSQICSTCFSLKRIFIHDVFSNVPMYCYKNNSLTKVTFSKNIEVIGQNCFAECYVLPEIIIPDTVRTIMSYAFKSCTNLRLIKFSKNLKTIDGWAFQYFCYYGILDFSNCITIPTLHNKAFDGSIGSGSYLKIIVPDALYDEWVIATNWANFANRIIKASEYELTQQ